ncbi:TPA: hypothetical protein HIC05_004891 [Escherichia coli]|nr:hypothetical protein [Escherichia coli]
MKEIIDGFLKFQREAFPKREALFKQLATQQSPRTLFISCSDSRLVPELVTQPASLCHWPLILAFVPYRYANRPQRNLIFKPSGDPP